jgi:glucokinase
LSTYLGIDVGGTKILGAYLVREEPELTVQLATPTSDYTAFIGAINQVVEETRQRGGTINRLCIGLPGTVTGERVIWMPNLPFLNGKNLAGDLAGLLKLPVELANDAQLALLGEVWRGAARHSRSAVLLSIGTGVGGAIMVGGNIIRGVHGSAGAFGWLNLDWREAANSEHGYVERHVSGSALNELARRLDLAMTSRDLIARVRNNDEASKEVVRHFSTLLGIACASIASILDPEIIIIAGGLSEAFELFAPILHEQIEGYGSPSVRGLSIVPALLGKDAAAYGALRAVIPPQVHWM